MQLKIVTNSEKHIPILEKIFFNKSKENGDVDFSVLDLSINQNVREKAKDCIVKTIQNISENIKDKKYIICISTIVIGTIIYDKVKSKEELELQLKKLSGRSHKILSAFFYVNKEKDVELNFKKIKFDISKIYIKRLSDMEVKYCLNDNDFFNMPAYTTDIKFSRFTEKSKLFRGMIYGLPVVRLNGIL